MRRGNTRAFGTSFQFSFSNFGLPAQGEFPKKDTVRRAIQRVCGAIDVSPVQPADRASIVLTERYKQYESSPGKLENFLILNSGAGDKN